MRLTDVEENVGSEKSDLFLTPPASNPRFVESAPSQRLDGESLRSTIEACRQGNRDSFGRLFEALGPQMFSLARSLSRDDHAAEEICQVVFVKLFSALEGFRGDSRFETWLFRIIVNASRDENRRKRRLVPLEEISADLPAPHSAFPESDFARRQESELLWIAVASLPRKLREPVVLRYREELSYGEIAVVLGCSAGTVASRLHRGHRILARRLSLQAARRE